MLRILLILGASWSWVIVLLGERGGRRGGVYFGHLVSKDDAYFLLVGVEPLLLLVGEKSQPLDASAGGRRPARSRLLFRILDQHQLKNVSLLFMDEPETTTIVGVLLFNLHFNQINHRIRSR
jgi:hypothetical protein